MTVLDPPGKERSFKALRTATRGPMRQRSWNGEPFRAGFSLLELLAVMAILGLLIAISLSAYSAITQATAIMTGAGLLSDVLSEAREEAVTKNTSVEVRIYDVPGSSDSTPAYRAVQLHWLEANGTRPPLAAPVFLPNSVVIDPTALHSSLIAANTQAVAVDPSDPRLNDQTRIFHFLADGSTDLTPGKLWFLTLRAAAAADPAHFPSDWACLTVDATTGHLQTFRP